MFTHINLSLFRFAYREPIGKFQLFQSTASNMMLTLGKSLWWPELETPCPVFCENGRLLTIVSLGCLGLYVGYWFFWLHFYRHYLLIWLYHNNLEYYVLYKNIKHKVQGGQRCIVKLYTHCIVATCRNVPCVCFFLRRWTKFTSCTLVIQILIIAKLRKFSFSSLSDFLLYTERTYSPSFTCIYTQMKYELNPENSTDSFVKYGHC